METPGHIGNAKEIIKSVILCRSKPKHLKRKKKKKVRLSESAKLSPVILLCNEYNFFFLLIDIECKKMAVQELNILENVAVGGKRGLADNTVLAKYTSLFPS